MEPAPEYFSDATFLAALTLAGRLVFFDTETTALDPRTYRVAQGWTAEIFSDADASMPAHILARTTICRPMPSACVGSRRNL